MADTPNITNLSIKVDVDDEALRRLGDELAEMQARADAWQRGLTYSQPERAKKVVGMVKVGPVVYTVGEHDWPPDKEAGSQAMGRTFSSEGKIMLLRSMPPDVKHVTLWHEIIHVILDQAGQDASEGVIEALSHGVVATLGDNPWLGDNAYAVFPPNPEPTS